MFFTKLLTGPSGGTKEGFTSKAEFSPLCHQIKGKKTQLIFSISNNGNRVYLKWAAKAICRCSFFLYSFFSKFSKQSKGRICSCDEILRNCQNYDEKSILELLQKLFRFSREVEKISVKW